MSSSLLDAILYGDMITNPICFPPKFFTYLITIFFPPLGTWINQHNMKYPNPGKIAICFILTALFYFPGLIYALNDLSCGTFDMAPSIKNNGKIRRVSHTHTVETDDTHLQRHSIEDKTGN